MLAGCSVLRQAQDDTQPPVGPVVWSSYRRIQTVRVAVTARAPVRIKLVDGGEIPVVFVEMSNCPLWPMSPTTGFLLPGAFKTTRQTKRSCFIDSGQFARYVIGAPTEPPLQCTIKAEDVSGKIYFSIDYRGSKTACSLLQTGPRSATLTWKRN